MISILISIILIFLCDVKSKTPPYNDSMYRSIPDIPWMKQHLKSIYSGFAVKPGSPHSLLSHRDSFVIGRFNTDQEHITLNQTYSIPVVPSNFSIDYLMDCHIDLPYHQDLPMIAAISGYYGSATFNKVRYAHCELVDFSNFYPKRLCRLPLIYTRPSSDVLFKIDLKHNVGIAIDLNNGTIIQVFIDQITGNVADLDHQCPHNIYYFNQSITSFELDRDRGNILISTLDSIHIVRIACGYLETLNTFPITSSITYLFGCKIKIYYNDATKLLFIAVMNTGWTSPEILPIFHEKIIVMNITDINQPLMHNVFTMTPGSEIITIIPNQDSEGHETHIISNNQKKSYWSILDPSAAFMCKNISFGVDVHLAALDGHNRFMYAKGLNIKSGYGEVVIFRFPIPECNNLE